MDTSSSLFEHPISFKQIGDFLVFSCPDMKFVWSTNIPRTKSELLEAHLQFLSKIKKRKREYSESSIKIPKPSKISIAETKSEKEVFLSSKQAASKIEVSVRKIQIDVEKGLLKADRSTGGSLRKGRLRFTLPSLLAYKAVLEAMSKNSNWVTPHVYALAKGISVNTARNWADSGKVVSKKSSGSHRLILVTN